MSRSRRATNRSYLVLTTPVLRDAWYALAGRVRGRHTARGRLADATLWEGPVGATGWSVRVLGGRGDRRLHRLAQQRYIRKTHTPPWAADGGLLGKRAGEVPDPLHGHLARPHRREERPRCRDPLVQPPRQELRTAEAVIDEEHAGDAGRLHAQSGEPRAEASRAGIENTPAAKLGSRRCIPCV